MPLEPSKELHGLMLMASDLASKEFTEKGAVQPMIYFMGKHGEIILFPPPPIPHAEAIEVVRNVAQRMKVIRTVFVMESWVVRVQHPTEQTKLEMKTKDLSTHPDRVEVIAISGEDEQSGYHMAYRTIERPEKGRPALKELEFHEMKQGEGRLTGLIFQGTKQ